MNEPLAQIVETELLNNLEDAERLGICLVPMSRSERSLFRRRLEDGLLVRPRLGCYARGEYWESLGERARLTHVVRTLGMRHPTWVFSHATAAFCHGFEVTYRLVSPIHYLTRQRGGGNAGGGLAHHRADLFEWGTFGDIKLTSPLRTVFDCLCTYPLQQCLPIADSAVRSGAVRLEELRAYVKRAERTRGIEAARRAVALVDPRAESGAESAMRATLVECRIPIFDLQFSVPDPEESWRTFRIDIVVTRPDGGRVAVEVDGKGKYDDESMTQGLEPTEVRMRERQREARVTACGMPVARFSASDVCKTRLVLRRLAAYGVVPATSA